MTHPAADFPDDRARWLIEALSLTSSESALDHLCQGWARFSGATAVFIGQLTPAHLRGVFVCAKENSRHCLDNSRFFPAATQSDVLRLIEPQLPLADLARQAVISLDGDDQPIGWVWLWTKGEELTADCDWLRDASARLLGGFSKLEEKLFADKLDALGEFAAGAGHEINNPVATISGRAQSLLQNETDPERRRQLAAIGGQALRIRDMIGDAMLFARPPEPDPEFLELSQVLPKILRPLEEKFEQARADFACDLAEGACLFADRTQLAVVITELLRNSLESLGETRTIHLKAEAVQTTTGPMTRIVIEDDGQSFTDEELAHAFDPFFSGRQAGRGLGFGLPKCWRIVSNHHGNIHIARLGDAGTRVTVIWPAYDFRDSETS